jgi:hypothetical protein
MPSAHATEEHGKAPVLVLLVTVRGRGGGTSKGTTGTMMKAVSVEIQGRVIAGVHVGTRRNEMPHMSVQYSHMQHLVPLCTYLHAYSHLTYIPTAMCGISFLFVHACSRRQGGRAVRMCAVVNCSDEHAFYISSPNRMWHQRVTSSVNKKRMTSARSQGTGHEGPRKPRRY